MNSTKIARMLRNVGYRLERDIFGWIAVDSSTGEEHRFSTLGGVHRFVEQLRNSGS